MSVKRKPPAPVAVICPARETEAGTGSASGVAVPHPTPQRDVDFPRRRHGEGGQSWLGFRSPEALIALVMLTSAAIGRPLGPELTPWIRQGSQLCKP
jgi:hypothetical protein